MTSSPPKNLPIVQLLDSSHGRPIHFWDCAHLARITIGRSSDQDIAISDTYVSRRHAEIEFTDQGWRLTALGRHGVFLDGQSIETAYLSAESVIRLGAGGPTLKFIGDIPATSHDAQNGFPQPDTMLTTQIQMLTLEDLETRDRDERVGEIAGSDFFRIIKEKAVKLRGGR